MLHKVLQGGSSFERIPSVLNSVTYSVFHSGIDTCVTECPFPPSSPKVRIKLQMSLKTNLNVGAISDVVAFILFLVLLHHN